ncbi:hypothetical protein AGABI2DRAFT_194994 [Agaricus bisporus var. bisporus H97]|uniref:hypothetical protein n=1 Tax=Agaricus bisporus var. bisporus (strain H97 / ATCC MYA-4626 / FGSC 10389) TaxID=936046 RepID=UPI00029F735B|nr:hypothetical protein AGABI2DRAFT_194994 [Agaricus bisporus var. bisporus H97]EKV44216.1 hypothetical protein AGABI2DRAFT_194994 [Agaricus bisporus var. bisporus H97]
MDFLESDAIVAEAVSVLRRELAKLSAREVALNDALLVKSQAEKRLIACTGLREEVDKLKRKKKEVKQHMKEQESINPNQLDSLQAKIDKSTAKAKRYQGLKSDIQKEIETLQQNLREPPKPLLYEQILAGYPSVSRPGKHELEPVGKDWQSLEEILNFNEYTEKQIPESVLLPYSIGWYPPHAVVFAPTITFNERTRRWIPFSLSHGYDGKSYHLFVSNCSSIFYRGIYKFRRIQNHKCSDIRQAKGFDGCVDQILDFTNFASSTKDDWKYLEYLFLDDVLPLECMVLQCLGFDRDLYENLIQQYRSK